MKLEVGKYYKNRDGKVVKIVKYEEDEDFYRSVTQCTYTPRGSYFSNGTSPYDLIEEVVPVPAYRVKAKQTDKRDFVKSMEGEKGKVYTKFEILPDDYEKFIDMGGWSYYATQVDAGYTDPITKEFVMNVNESKKLKLEVGKTYKTRGGEIVKIVSAEGWDQYKFRDSNRWTYTEEGLRYDWIADHKRNLIEEVEVETKKPKLKLEVGKTYRDGYGELHTIVSNESNSVYPKHVYRAENRSYTVEGFWQSEKKVHKYNLIEEVETTTATTKKEQPKMKYYRTTEKNTESHFPLGTIVTLHNDDGTRQPTYKDVNTGKTRYLYTDRLEEINVKTVKTVISPASKLAKILEDSGYEVYSDGHWRKPDKETFASKMFYFCGENPSSNSWNWLPEWLEEKVVFDSVVNTFNARQFIVDFMKKKRELSHEAYLYQRDIDEIENEWSGEECEKVAGRILAQGGLGFGTTSCPFCIKFYGECDDCSYGKRHGVCSNDDSDFGKYIKPVAYSRDWPELMDFVNNYPGARK